MCYLDDIVIFRRTFSEHNERVDVLECIGNAGLVLNAKKCRFGKRQTLVLGHLINKDGIRPDPNKTVDVKAFKPPRSTKELCSFLGLCSYFCNLFVPLLTLPSHWAVCFVKVLVLNGHTIARLPSTNWSSYTRRSLFSGLWSFCDDWSSYWRQRNWHRCSSSIALQWKGTRHCICQ